MIKDNLKNGTYVKKKVMYNALMLALVSIFLRCIGISFNAYVAGRLGEEGMGLYSLITSVYGFAVTLACSGVNLAAVTLVAKVKARFEEKGLSSKYIVKAVMRNIIAYSLFFGLTACFLLAAFSGIIGEKLLSDRRSILGLKIIAVSLPALALSSGISGYFTAVRKVYKNVIVMVGEQILKILFICAAIAWLIPKGSEYGCIAVIGGSAAVEILSFLVQLIFYITDDKGKDSGKKSGDLENAGFSDVWKIAFPVAVGSYARQGLTSAQHMAVPWGLRLSGAAAGAALASYGVLHGMALPLVLFPLAVITSAGSLVVPEFASLAERGATRRIAELGEKVISLTLIFSIGTAGVFLTFWSQLGNAVYSSTEAARMIRILAPLVPIMYLDSAVDMVLKGVGEQIYSMKINIIDAAISLVMVLILVPWFGIYGYIIVIYVSEAVNGALSINRLANVVGLKPRLITRFLLPMAAAAAADIFIRAADKVWFIFIGQYIPVYFAVALYVIIYFIISCIGLKIKKSLKAKG